MTCGAFSIVARRRQWRDMNEPLAPDPEAWVDLLRTPLPHLDPAGFAQLHPVGVDHADGVTSLRIQPTHEVKRALAPWTRRFGTTVPAFTSLDAEAGALLEAPGEAARWLRERPVLCCAVPVLDDLLIAARAMAAQGTGADVTLAAQDLAYAAAGLVVQACEAWPGAQLPWSDLKNRPTLRLVAQAVDLALAAQDDERAHAWQHWMLARDPEDAHGWRSR
jgi:hypothetical protein